MKTKFAAAAFIVGATILASGARAQNAIASAASPNNPAPVATPSSPAPNVQDAPASVPALVPSQTIFASRLPTPAELTDGAAKQGLGVDRIEQSATQVTVLYRYADGQTKTVGYQILPSAQPTAMAPVVVPATPVPAPSVVYYDPSPRVIYYDRGYYPYYYPPVSLRLGFGFGYHGGGGGFRYRH